MSTGDLYSETITLPRAVRFPVELVPPEGFDSEQLNTWPRLAGRLECLGGKLLYMPPCGDLQQDTVTDVVITLGQWVRAHPSFVLGTNEAGMRLRGDTRAADAAIWRRAELGSYQGGLRRVPPVLAVEVASDDEPRTQLLEKARWYLSVGVPLVWLLFPRDQQVLVLTAAGQTQSGLGEVLPHNAHLPGLSAAVADLFEQVRAEQKVPR